MWKWVGDRPSSHFPWHLAGRVIPSHVFSFQPISQQFIRARSAGQTRLTGRTRLARKCEERAEKRKAEQQERGREPGIKRGHLIRTSRITASQTERSLSVADTTELCSLSPPFSPPQTLSFTEAARRTYRMLNRFSVWVWRGGGQNLESFQKVASKKLNVISPEA